MTSTTVATTGSVATLSRVSLTSKGIQTITIVQQAMQHNRPAYLAELSHVACIRRLHNDRAGALEIEQSIIALEAGESVDTEWATIIAKRFIHVLS